VSDGTDSTLASQSFTLDQVNDAPTGTATATLVSAAEDQDSGYTINVSSLLEGFSDPDLDSLDVTILVARDEDNNQFDVARDGDTYTIALPENFNGTVSISYDVTDGIDITSASQSFNVTAVNDASTSFDVSVSTLEDIPYIIQTLDFTFSDDEGDNLQAVKITSLPTKGTLRFNGVAFTAGTVISIGDIALGKLVFEPTPNENGVAYANFTFQLQDDGGTANGGINLSPEKTFTIDVIAVNDAPKLTGEKATLIDGSEGASYTITASQLLTGYTDAEGDTLSILDLDAGVGFTIDDNGDGTYTVNPPTNYNGPVNLTYKVSDGTTSTASTQTFTLIATNDGGGGTDKSSLATLSRKNILNDVFEINKRVDTLLNARDFYDTTNDAYQAYENSVVLNKLNAIQAGLSNIKLADTDELFFVGMSGGLAKEPSGEANKDVPQKDSIAVIKDKIFRNAETPPTPITDSKGRIIYQLPETIFKGAQGVIKLAATSKDGSPLPDWIKFDSKTGKLTAEVPKDVKSPIEIKIEAVDTRGHKAETTLKILPRPNNMSLSGKHSLSSQFKSAFDLIA
jgi:hypothetical protein